MSGLSPPPVRNVCMCECLTLFADHPDHLIILRKHVSRITAGRGRAVLEGVGLESQIIEACYRNNRFKEEEAVQDGLTRWLDGQGQQPPTCSMLIEAMEHAEIEQQYIQDLKKELDLLGMLFVTSMLCCVCVCTSALRLLHNRRGKVWSDSTGFRVLCRNVCRPIRLQDEVFAVNEHL